MRRRGVAGPLVAAALLALGFLPWADLIPGGRHLQRPGEVYDGWWSGALLVSGLGILYALITRRSPRLWPEGAWDRFAARIDLLSPRHACVLAIVAFVVYATIATMVFDRHPLLIDEIVQVWQARLYAAGRLVATDAGPAPFFGTGLSVDDGTRSFSQFPAGGPAMLALGALLRAEWLVGPFFGALAVWAFAGVLRALRQPRDAATAALLLAAFSPFVLFMSGTHMNHTPTLAWICVGLWGVARLTNEERPALGAALLAGVGFGLAAAIRPVDGFVFALPAGLWSAYQALRDPRWRAPMLAFGLAAALPVAGDLLVNAATTGHPFLFGYRLLWGPAHELGFHQAPWGAAHTPTLGLEQVATYFFQLQTYWLETPIPALLPVAVALSLAGRLSRFDRLLLAASALLVLFYFAYWHAGFFPGPRFMYPLVPFLVLWTARAPALLRAALGDRLAYRATMGAWVASLAIGVVIGVPMRAREYRHFARTPRWEADRAADEAGVHDALIFVRESWGAQVVVRLWGRGLTRADTEYLYHRVDLCRLDSAIAALESDGVRSDSAAAGLRSLVADSARLIPSPFSLDGSEPFLPGSVYSPHCLRRVREDQAGFTVHTPLILAGRDRNNLYARDLHGADTTLVLAHPTRALWLVTADTTAGAWPAYHRLDVDSAWAAWRRGE